jgi:hypothetical protein
LVGLASFRNSCQTKLFAGFIFPRLCKANSRSAAILVDELYSRFFECAFDYLNCGSSWLACSSFQLVDSDGSNACTASQLLLTPGKQASGCPALRGGNQAKR